MPSAPPLNDGVDDPLAVLAVEAWPGRCRAALPVSSDRAELVDGDQSRPFSHCGSCTTGWRRSSGRLPARSRRAAPSGGRCVAGPRRRSRSTVVVGRGVGACSAGAVGGVRGRAVLDQRPVGAEAVPAVVVGRPTVVASVVVVGRRRATLAVDRAGEHRPELQLGGLADQVERPVLVLHARDLDEDVVALAGDLRLGDAEGVDALADDRDGFVDRVARRRRPSGWSTTDTPPWRSRPEQRLVVDGEGVEQRDGGDRDDRRSATSSP